MYLKHDFELKEVTQELIEEKLEALKKRDLLRKQHVYNTIVSATKLAGITVFYKIHLIFDWNY